jgi:hypothetical protein
MNFTRTTMLRLVAFYRLVESRALERVVHVENDQMVYGSARELADAADACGLRLGMTRVSASRFAPAVVYARDAAALRDMVDFILAAITGGGDTVNRVGKGYPTDMSITASFFEAKAALGGANATAFAALPDDNDDGSCVARATRAVYDGAGLGSWCCGDFYSPSKHFVVKVPESAVKYWERPFEWRVERDLRLPFWNGSAVWNLHMHSKHLHLWKSEDLVMHAGMLAHLPDRN